jgi:hypothetical protein
MMLGLGETLFEKLEEGEHFRNRIKETIYRLRGGRELMVNKPSASTFRVEELANRVKDILLPSINLAINTAFSHSQSEFLTSTLPLITASPTRPAGAALVHPSILRHIKDRGYNGFQNALQAQATQILFEGKCSLLYISPTGEFFFLKKMLYCGVSPGHVAYRLSFFTETESEVTCAGFLTLLLIYDRRFSFSD